MSSTKAVPNIVGISIDYYQHDSIKRTRKRSCIVQQNIAVERPNHIRLTLADGHIIYVSLDETAQIVREEKEAREYLYDKQRSWFLLVMFFIVFAFLLLIHLGK